jgi:hypothetical protein
MEKNRCLNTSGMVMDCGWLGARMSPAKRPLFHLDQSWSRNPEAVTIRRLRLKSIAAILLGLALCNPISAQQKSKQGDGPSLEDTFDWMKSTLKSQGSIHEAHLPFETSYTLFAGEDARKKFLFPKDSTCPVVFVKIQAWKDRPKGCPLCPLIDKTGIAVDLRDIDPGKILLIKKDAVLSMTTTDLQPKIFLLSDPIGDSDEFKHYGEMTQAILELETYDYAERLTKAFEHAVKLCGGRPSTF